MKPRSASAVDVVTLGECMAVLFPEPGAPLEHARRLRLDIAGTEANTAIGLSRLGISARFITRVGDDPFGSRIRRVLSAEGVDTRFVLTDPVAPTGVFFREALVGGARRVYYYRAGSAASRLGPEDLTPEAFAGAKIVHLSGITPALSVACAAAVGRAIELAREGGAIVSLDPNYRPRLWDAATARATLTALIRRVDVLLMSDEDAQVLFPGADVRGILEGAVAIGPATVVLKRAAKGAVALARGERLRTRARRVARVVDSVGAGDGFNAGFLAGMLRGLDTAGCLDLGAVIGARAVQTLGDYAGYPKQQGKGKREKGRVKKRVRP